MVSSASNIVDAMFLIKKISYICSILIYKTFQGMDFTTDKLRSLVKKWQTLIEAHVDVKTTDNFTLRMFCIGFTKRRQNQVKRTCYAQSSQIKQVILTIVSCYLTEKIVL